MSQETNLTTSDKKHQSSKPKEETKKEPDFTQPQMNVQLGYKIAAQIGSAKWVLKKFDFWCRYVKQKYLLVLQGNFKKQTMIFSGKNKTKLVNRTSGFFEKNNKLDQCPKRVVSYKPYRV